MPQPLSRVDNSSRYVFEPRGGGYDQRRPFFELRPQFASLAMECVVEWSLMETDVLKLFSYLSGGPLQLAFQIYASLNGSGPKTAALLTLVKTQFSDDHLSLFNDVRRMTRSCEGRRNALVHWTWGFFIDREDACLLVDPIDYVNRIGALDQAKIQVWFEKDFLDLAQETRALSTCYRLMSQMAPNRIASDPVEAATRLAEVLEDRGFLSNRTG